MANSLPNHNVVQALARCAYSTKPATKSSLFSYDLQTSNLPNKLRVVSARSDLPYGRVTVTYRAGSRFEGPDNLGITSVLRSICGLSTKYSTPFGITRNIQQFGANFYATVDRETLSYTVEASRENLPDAMTYLAYVATSQQFRPWEVSDYAPQIKQELALTPPEALLFDLLHSSAFSQGLGNSLYCKEHRVSKITPEHLMQYAEEHFTSGKGQVSGVGISHEELLGYAEALDLPFSPLKSAPSSVYLANHSNVPTDEPFAYAALAVEAPGFTKKDSAAFMVLSNALGGRPSVKYGSSHGILSKAANKTEAVGAVCGSFYVQYSDSGLLGCYMKCQPQDAGKILEASLSALKSGSLSDQDCERGKSLTKSKLADYTSSSLNLVEACTKYAGLDGVKSPRDILAELDAVTANDVKAAAKKVASGAIAVAACGNSSYVPHLACLKK